MKLMHYTAEPLHFDAGRTYEQRSPSTFAKPAGLWVSVPGDDDWPSWCRSEEFAQDRLTSAHRVTVAPSANILYITSSVGIDSLTARFAIQTDWDRQWSHRRDDRTKWPIDWPSVAREWDGIIIAPYQYARRYSYDWYYGWDCASGCIWNLEAIAAVEPVTEAAIS